jgi:hypothetical protein
MEKTTEQQRQEWAEQLVDREIWHNLCQTMQQEIENSSGEVLYNNFANYTTINEKGEPDENGDSYPEIMEWWAVSGYLYNILKEKGEVVGEVLDFYVWGRQCTGQMIAMDSLIEGIAEEMYK